MYYEKKFTRALPGPGLWAPTCGAVSLFVWNRHPHGLLVMPGGFAPPLISGIIIRLAHGAAIRPGVPSNASQQGGWIKEKVLHTFSITCSVTQR